MGSALFIAALAGVFSSNEVLDADLHSSPSCGTGYSNFTLKWGPDDDELDWTDGSLTETFAYIDGSQTTFTCTYSGNTEKFGKFGPGSTPNIQSFFPGGDKPALSQYITSGFTGSQHLTLTIDISPAIPATMAFDLYHINGSSYSGDKITIYAEPEAGGSNIIPTYTSNGSASWEDQGSGTINAIASSTSGTNAYVGVSFNNSTLVDKLVIKWTECDICGAGVHGIGIGNIDFCSIPYSVDPDKDKIDAEDDIDDDNDGIPDVVEICGTAAASSVDIQVLIQLDKWASENSWILFSGTDTFLRGNSYSVAYHFVDSTYTGVAGKSYTFTMFDSYGDGMGSMSGYYQIKVDNQTVVDPVYWTSGSSATATFTATPGTFHCIDGDPNHDADHDGIPNYKDSDFCTLNAQGVCASMDSDSDGVPNHLDLDSDNDGIPDIVEAGGTDANGDGSVDSFADPDKDGLATVFETSHGSTSIFFDQNGDGTNEEDGNFDGDNVPNWQDLDADGDGITDITEVGGTDENNDGIFDTYATDTDEDGYGDAIDGDVGNDGTTENSANSLILTSADANSDAFPDSGYPNGNTDSDLVPDFLDLDADGDGITDNVEGQSTSTYVAPANSDTDLDGIDNSYDKTDGYGGSGVIPINTDTKDQPDYTDTNSDDDSESDSIEGHDSNGDGVIDGSDVLVCNAGKASGTDLDKDGLDDGYDNNPSSADPTNGNLKASNHPITDNGSDRDWRYDGGSLPLEWLGFAAHWQDQQVYLRWETQNEVNTDFFEIERKIDLSNNFHPIGNKEAKGNYSGISSYQYQDVIPRGLEEGALMYYRIRQVDMDGQFSYSKTIELSFSSSTATLSVFPNPANEQVSIDVKGANGTQTMVRIIDMLGKIKYSQVLPEQGHLNLDVSQWPRGIYIVQLEDEQSIRASRLVVN